MLRSRRAEEKSRLTALTGVLLALVIGMGLNLALPAEPLDRWDEDAAPWQTKNREDLTEEAEAAASPEERSVPETESGGKPVEDGFVKIEGGSFLMGSPETENWRIEDETQHEVTVSGFWMSPYEVSQAEYERLMGENPSHFKGESLPVENVSWLDAVRFCNAKSIEAGLTPAYTLDGETVVWNRTADDYRLPTEAEWEYACRAGTAAPFYTIHAIGPEEANYYGHYPYEIEENYFDDSVLETRPGQYRQTTVEVDSFDANPWGLYNMHGNVNEWCWDLYGEYDLVNIADPTGPETGSRRVYRGGGRFGQILTAIAKLAPQAVIAPGLSVHYSGGSGLPGDAQSWLESQGIHSGSND